jgi:hypothetical protein
MWGKKIVELVDTVLFASIEENDATRRREGRE